MKPFGLMGAALALASLCLAGCQTTGPAATAAGPETAPTVVATATASLSPIADIGDAVASVQQAAANDLPTLCAQLAAADEEFKATSATGVIGPTAVKDEAAAMAGIGTACAAPSATTNLLTAAPIIALAIVQVTDALNSKN
jgi:hypothetical protein